MPPHPTMLRFLRPSIPVIALLLAACSGGDSPSIPTASAEACVVAPLCEDRLEVAPDRYVRHYRSHDLDAGAPGVTRALVIIHGAGRAAEYNFATGSRATGLRNVRSSVAVVAPLFITTEESPGGDEPFWTSGGWKRGHLSVSGGPVPRISSYEVLDSIVGRLSDPGRFPDMTEIVVAGHSAGGQVVHRYAAGGTEPLGVPVRYVVANPSTWLFPGPERPDGAGFSIPDPESCPDYQEWHYGLENLNSYMSRLSVAEIEDRLVSRDVTVMLGDQDTGSLQLDVTCGANLQGEHRYARGLNLLAWMDQFRPGHRHVGIVVPGVAHSSRGIFLSEPGLDTLLP